MRAGPGPGLIIQFAGRARARSAQLLRTRAGPGPQIMLAGRAWAYISGPCRALLAESLPAGSGEDWLCWRSLNRLRTGVGRARTVTSRWAYLDDAQSVDCYCGERQTIAHLLSCRLLYETCTVDDLATVTDQAKACRPQVGENCAKDTTEEEITSIHKPVLARAPLVFTKLRLAKMIFFLRSLLNVLRLGFTNSNSGDSWLV